MSARGNQVRGIKNNMIPIKLLNLDVEREILNQSRFLLKLNLQFDY